MDLITVRTTLKKLFSVNNLVLFLSIIALLPKTTFLLPGNGVDPSFFIGLDLIVKQKLVFGKDIILTYGPLGFLWTFSTTTLNTLLIILYNLFIVFCKIFIVKYFVDQLQSNISKVVLFIVIVFATTIIFQENAILLMVFFLFFIFYSNRTKSRWPVYIAGFIAIISFYIKMNTGLLLSGLLVIYILFQLYTKAETLKFTVIFSILYLSLFIVLARFLHVSILLYILYSLEIIDKYNDAVNIPAPVNILIYAAIILSIYLLILIFNFRLIIFSKTRLLIYGFVSISLFVLFKYGFVRADMHMLTFFFNLVSLYALLYFFETEKRFKTTLLFGLITTGFLSILAVQIMIPGYDPVNMAIGKISKLPYSDLLLNEYPLKYKQAILIEKYRAKFPDKILQKLEGKKVDIMPWDISYLMFNGLNYTPRPVIESYCVFSNKLDQLNANMIGSNKAPDYLIYANGSIDNRVPFWDESLTKLRMLTHYVVEDKFRVTNPQPDLWLNSDFILMRKKSKANRLIEVGSHQYTYTVGDTFLIPKTQNLLYLYADFNYSAFGKLKRFLYQPNRMTVTLMCDDTNHTSTNYLAIVPIMKGGVLINKKVITTEDARLFFSTQGRENTDIKAACFSPKSIGFLDKVTFTLKEYMVD